MTRILVYSHDTFGLGNIRRMVRIAEALAAQDPDVSVLLLTGSPMLHAFRLPPRIDYVKLPCLARDTNGDYGVKHLDMAFNDAVRMRASLILSAASDFDPDIILIDKKPLGVAGELGSMLELMSRRWRPPSIHLLLRDILDTPEATRRVWEDNDYHGAIERFYDSVMVVGEASVFDLAEAYAFPAKTRAKLFYCGYINRADPTHAARPAGAADSGQRVLIHAGGGQDGVALMEAAIDAIRLAGSDHHISWSIVGGPELPAPHRERLSRAAMTLPAVEWIDFSDAMGERITAANLVISMGGYNSVCEILSYQKRAIIVPRSVPVREQRIRAEAMDALGLLRMLPLEELSPQRLLREALLELSMDNVVNSRTARIRFTGLDTICQRLLPLRTPRAVSRQAAGFL
jgi:predicted glycosyltransferase